VLAGGHYTLRMGNDGLGGALAYGAQIGNGRYRIAGNAFAAHSDAANRFVAALDASELAQARLDTPPSELLLQPLGAGARFPGVAWSRVSPRARELAESLLGQVLATFAPAAGRDIDPGSLHFATYASRGFYPDRRPGASCPRRTAPRGALRTGRSGASRARMW
jgi:hypothetical protein